MGKRSLTQRQFDTQPQLTRIHALVKRIQQGDYPSQKILGAEWEKSPRTIQRDLDYVRDVLGLPLAYDKDLPRVQQLAGSSSVHVVKKSGGKYLLTNREISVPRRSTGF